MMVHALLSSLVLAAGPLVLDVAPSESRIGFEVIHKLHEVKGASANPEGRVAIRPDGTTQVMIRAAIATFDSGDGNRDSHMREVLEAAKFPHVTFKGITKLEPPENFPATLQPVVNGELQFHGVTHRERVPVTIEWLSPTELKVRAQFEISLEKYGVERPSLLFVKIDDACKLDVALSLKARSVGTPTAANPSDSQ